LQQCRLFCEQIISSNFKAAKRTEATELVDSPEVWLYDDGEYDEAFNNRFSDARKKNREAFRKIVQFAMLEVGVREKGGHNSGRRVEAYLDYVGFKKGAPWCAAFVSWVFAKAGHKAPRTAWSPALFPASHRARDAIAGYVFGIYIPSLERIGHCGIVETVDGDWLRTIEGNTSVAGSREGDGVYRRSRHKRSIRYYADWIAKGF